MHIENAYGFLENNPKGPEILGKMKNVGRHKTAIPNTVLTLALKEETATLPITLEVGIKSIETMINGKQRLIKKNILFATSRPNE